MFFENMKKEKKKNKSRIITTVKSSMSLSGLSGNIIQGSTFCWFNTLLSAFAFFIICNKLSLTLIDMWIKILNGKVDGEKL